MLQAAPLYQAMLGMEMQGLAMRGAFERGPTDEPHAIEWCERRILQRIHRLTLAHARRQVESVSPQVYLRWLLGWQHVAPQTQLTGEEGLLDVLHTLEGFEAPAIEWERSILPARLAHYDPRWLDQLCLSGAVGWGRISPHPAASDAAGRPRRVIPTNAAPITFYLRETADWLAYALAQESIDERVLEQTLSAKALRIREILRDRGACFAPDLQRTCGFTRQETAHGLWELATAGLAAADGFDQLRALMDVRRRSATAETTGKRAVRTTAGRWSLLHDTAPGPALEAASRARETDQALESYARMLLARYGVLFRDLLARESNAPRWRELLGILRRLEARGEVRGGRFVSGFSGEQFALPEAVQSLRDSRHRDCAAVVQIAAADPLNLSGWVFDGERVPSVPNRHVSVSNGRYLQQNPLDPSGADPETSGAEVGAEVPVVQKAALASQQMLQMNTQL